jgi:hypothetical protein
MFVHEQYPQLKCLTHRKIRKWYVFRGQYGRRRLYTHGYTPEFAMMHFVRQIMYKAYPQEGGEQ